MMCFVLLLTALGCGNGVVDLSAAPAGTTSATTKTFSVMAYGAKGNGTADDGIAIQAAMSAAAAAGGGTVTFPCGEYAVLSVAGAAPAGRSALYLKGATGITLQGLGSCSHVFTALPQKTVIEFENSTHISVTAMKITALNTIYVETYGMGGGSAVRFGGVSYGNISNLEVDGATAGAIYITEGTSNTSVVSNSVHDTYGSGIWEDDCGGASATSCAPSLPPTNNVYTSNTLTNTTLAGVTALTLDDGGGDSFAVIQGNTISWTYPPLPGYQPHCIQIGNASDASVLNNSCKGTPWDGIVITAAGGAAALRDTVQGNTIVSSGSPGFGGSGIVVYDDPTGGGISGFVVANNTILTAQTDGIRIYAPPGVGGVHDGQVTGNNISMVDQMSPGSRYGITVNTSANIAVSGNAISCNGSCIAVGVYIYNSTGTPPTTASNQVTNIAGVPLLVVNK